MKVTDLKVDSKAVSVSWLTTFGNQVYIFYRLVMFEGNK